MCGINFSFEEWKISIMNRMMIHRGLYATEDSMNGCHFGHVRLPIQNLSHDFDQPWRFKGKIGVYAGEVFNYQQIDSTAKCDTPVFFQSYQHINGLQEFDGFWSAVVYDGCRTLEIITDPLAKKPLYLHKESLDISSEIKALCAVNPPCPNPYYDAAILKWGYLIGNQTFDKAIMKLDPGYIYHIDTWARQIIQKQRYHTYRPNPCIDLPTALSNSVRARTESKTPISLLLSGGLDSSIIYHYLEKHTHDFRIYHIDNGEEEFLNYLNIPSDIPVHKIPALPTPSDQELDEILYYNESPFDLGSMLPQYHLAKAISKDVVHVVITGDGADELFGGYTRSETYDAQYSDIYDELVHYHLPRLDKLPMSHTIELRSPFLATPVIEYALSMPYSKRIRKNGLKEIFRGIVPDRIVDRKKEPLKSTPIRENMQAWRQFLVERFRTVQDQYYKGIYLW